MRPQAVSGWIKRYREGGFVALTAKKLGPEAGQTRQLTPEVKNHLQKLISDKAPDQFKFAYALWTRKAVMELIKQDTGITMPIRTVGQYL